MSVNLTPQKSAIFSAIVGKTDTLRFNDLSGPRKTMPTRIGCETADERRYREAHELMAACREILAAEDAREPEVVPLAGVYFAGSGEGPVKIGHTRDWVSRIKALQTGHPWKLNLLAIVVDADTSVERDYQMRFGRHRLHGEWFSPHPDILAEIERLTDVAA
jgi:hypothetical protein